MRTRFDLGRRACLVGGVTLACAAVATALVACTLRDVSVAVEAPSAIDADTRWYEVGAFDVETCLAPDALRGGVPAGAVLRKAFTKGKEPSFGEMKKGKYAFMAVAKRDDCTVLGAGCSVVDLGDSSEVKVSISAVQNGGGACGSGRICQAAQCVPPIDNSDPSVGAGCSLELVGAGPLADALGGAQSTDQVVVSFPAIAATSKGFLLAYRETLASTNARVTLMPVDTGGGALPPQQTIIDGCGALEDGVGIAFHQGAGLVAVAKPCPSPPDRPPGLLLFSVDEAGKGGYTLLNFNTPDPNQTKLSLGAAHSVTWSDRVNAFLFDYNLNGSAIVQSRPQSAVPQTYLPGAGKHIESQVVGSDNLVGILSRIPAGGDAGVVPDGGASQTLLANLVAADKLASLANPSSAPVTGWGSVATNGKRLFVLSDSGSSPARVVLRVYEPKTFAPDQLSLVVTDTSIGEGAIGTPTFADIAARGDRLFITIERVAFTTSGERQGSISLVVMDHANATPVRLRQVELGNDPRVPSIVNARDGRLAVATSDTRVGVVWATAAHLTTNDRVGGYAVFACRDGQ